MIENDSSFPDIRHLLLTGIDSLVNENNRLLDISRKILELEQKTFSGTDDVFCRLQICGFDNNIPRIYFVEPKIIRDVQYCLTWAEGITEYGMTVKGKSQINVLNQMIPNEQILEEKVRQFMTEAIAYENNKAKERGEKPKTGGGINIVTVYPK